MDQTDARAEIVDEKLEQCQARIGYRFTNRELLLSALTHASGADSRLASNERLEFLGDAVLGFTVCDELYRRFPVELEGELTRLKSIVVSRNTCARVSRRLGLEECLIVGKGMSGRTSLPSSLLAAVLEAIIAAIYLDAGIEPAREFIMRAMADEIDAAASNAIGKNFKSLLQQLVQREYGTTPAYLVLDEKGPDHNKNFQIAAQIGNRRFPAAWGKNKKEAEQQAACNAWSILMQERGETVDPAMREGAHEQLDGKSPIPTENNETPPGTDKNET
ncbi:hypothetical protein JCM19992_24540 [Thermostilla marina]